MYKNPIPPKFLALLTPYSTNTGILSISQFQPRYDLTPVRQLHFISCAMNVDCQCCHFQSPCLVIGLLRCFPEHHTLPKVRYSVMNEMKMTALGCPCRVAVYEGQGHAALAIDTVVRK